VRRDRKQEGDLKKDCREMAERHYKRGYAQTRALRTSKKRVRRPEN